MKKPIYNLFLVPFDNPDRTKHILWMDSVGNILLTHTSSDLHIPFHLYVTTTHEPKEGDWVLSQLEDESYNDVYKFDGTTYLSYDIHQIIASTDTQLGLPGLDMDFFNIFARERGRINHVMLEESPFGLKTSTDNNVIVEHYTEDLKVWDEISLGNPEPCLLGKDIDLEDPMVQLSMDIFKENKLPTTGDFFEGFVCGMWTSFELNKNNSVNYDFPRWIALNEYILCSEGWIQDSDSEPLSDESLYKLFLKSVI